MLATLEDAPLESAMAWSTSRSTTAFARSSKSIPGTAPPVRIWSRLGNEKTAQFPDLVAALTRYARKLKGPVVLDGEIVALDDKGEPAGFQRLQNRIHLTESHSRSAAGRVAFIAFDILRDRRRGSAAAAAHRAASAPRARLSQIPGRPFCARATWSRATRVRCINRRSITAGKASSRKTRARCITPANARATGGS